MISRSLYTSKALLHWCLPARTFSMQQSAKPSNKPYSKLKLLVASGAVLGLGYYYQKLSTAEKRQIRVTLSGFNRFIRSLSTGISISIDYSWNLRGLHKNSFEFNEAIKRCHQKAANSILKTCLQNGGLYIKMGQGLVSLNHLLPKEYIDTLTTLYDQALVREENELEELFAEDFGMSPEEVFPEFNRIPLAAASLAQVFKARTKNGEQVAVKVQYIDLLQRYAGDIATIGILVKIIGMVHPNFDFTWVMEYLTETLKSELDFINEGRNMERCGMELSHLPYVHVPKVYWDKSTARVLTAEFIDGVSISDMEGIARMGLSLADVDEKMINAFSEQIFFTGFVHADPHPGNVFVRKESNGSAQIVLLDHGLYEYLPETNRLALCNLWKSIVLKDLPNMKKYCADLGVEDYMLFSEILMQRPLDRRGIRIPNRMSDSDVKYMKEMAGKHFDKIMASIKGLPYPMLLVIRNINTVRSLTKIHGHPVDRYVLMARRAIQGAYFATKSGWLQSIYGRGQLIGFDLKLRCEQLKTIFTRFYLNLLVYFGMISRDGATEIFHLIT